MGTGKMVVIKSLLWGTLAALIVGLGLTACGGGGSSTGGAGPGGGGGGGGGSTPPGVVVSLPPPTLAVNCTNTVGTLALTAGALRATGVAPLAVYFDATATTSATTKPFHDIEYRWDFGDPGSGTWAQGSRPGVSSKNEATGAVAAHVFETAGPYTITVTAFDGVNTAMCTVAVTVQDPNVVFAGANTVCIGNAMATAGAGGCPAGASTPAGTANFNAALAACVGANKRCLFNRGDTFNSTAPGNISVAGPMLIGAYGAGALPLITSANILGVVNPAAGASDLRIMDLNITGSGALDTGTAASVTGNLNNITFLRTTISDIGQAIVVQSLSSMAGSVIQENTIFNIHAVSGGVGFFGWLINSAILGNLVGPFGPTAEHNVRVQPGQRVAVANNTLTTPGSNGGARTTLTIRATDHLTGGSSDPVNDTQYVHISDNKLIGGGASVQIFQVEPASSTQNNWIFDVIAERNWIVFGSVGQNGLYGQSVRLTARNNICDASGGATFRTCFGTTPGDITGNVPVPNDNQYLNNTCYSSDTSAQFECISLSAALVNVTNAVVKNNLAYAPLTPTAVMLRSAGVGVTGTIVGNNSSDAQVRTTDPLFAIAIPVNPADFRITAGSYAIGGGVSVPVWSDFFRTLPPTPRDMGAVNN